MNSKNIHSSKPDRGTAILLEWTRRITSAGLWRAVTEPGSRSCGKGETERLQGRFQTQGMGAETDLDCTQEAKNGNTQRGGRLDLEAAGWIGISASAGQRSGSPRGPESTCYHRRFRHPAGQQKPRRGAQATGLLRAGRRGKARSSVGFGGRPPGAVFLCPEEFLKYH